MLLQVTPYAQFVKRLPSWLYKISGQFYIKKDFPRHIFIETTASCQLKCSYCPRQQISENMDFGLFRKIVDEASQYGSRSFSLHLFGEPLLYPSFFEAVRYIKQRNKSNTVLITTNGLKLNECIDDFISCGIDQTYWTWRPETKFRESTLLKLRKWKRFRVRFINEITPKRILEKWSDWPNIEKRRMHNFGGWINLLKFQKQNVHSVLGNSIDRWPCYHLWLAPAVAWNGKFLMCCSDPHQKEVFGDINRESISDCWKKLEKVKQYHLKGEYKGICEKCDVWKVYPDLFFKFQKKVS